MKENFNSKATLATREKERVLIRIPEGEIIRHKARLHPLCSVATVKCLYFSCIIFFTEATCGSVGQLELW